MNEHSVTPHIEAGQSFSRIPLLLNDHLKKITSGKRISDCVKMDKKIIAKKN